MRTLAMFAVLSGTVVNMVLALGGFLGLVSTPIGLLAATTASVLGLTGIRMFQAEVRRNRQRPALSEMAQALGDPRRSQTALDQLRCRNQSHVFLEALQAPAIIARDDVLPYTRMFKWDQRLARLQAIEGLGMLRSAEAVGPLLAMLADADPDLRFRILSALGSIGQPSGAAAVVPFLGDHEEVFGARRCSHGPVGVRTMGELAAWALKAMGETDLVDAFYGTLNGSPESLQQLKSFETPSLVMALVKMVDHDNPVYAAHAMWALGELGVREALPELHARLRVLGADREMVRRACAQAIAQLEMLAALPRAARSTSGNETLPRATSTSQPTTRTLPKTVG